MADYNLLDLTHWDLIYPPAIVDAVSASANADASNATVLVDLLVDAVSASANADASAATVQSGFTALVVQAVSASARYQSSPCGVVEQGSSITTIWTTVTTTTVLQGIESVSFQGPRASISTLGSMATTTTLLGVPAALTLLAGISSTTLYATPQVI